MPNSTGWPDTPPQAPTAARKPHASTHHGKTIEDPYHWLRDPGYPEVTDPEILAHLEAENAYFEKVMAPHQALIDTLRNEIKGRMAQDDRSVPVQDGDFAYYWAFEKGAQYRRWYRCLPDADPSPGDMMILDEPALAASYPYFQLRALETSADGSALLWSADLDGSERCEIHHVDLTGEKASEKRPTNTSGAMCFAADAKGFFYVELSAELRPYRVLYQSLQDPQLEAREIYRETDPAFFVSISKSTSGQFLFITSADHVTSEVRFLPLDADQPNLKLISARRPSHEYHVDHGSGDFHILTNDQHRNFRLVRAPIDTPDEAHWDETVAASDAVLLRSAQAFSNAVVLAERENALDHVRILDPMSGGSGSRVSFPEEAYSLRVGANRMPTLSRLRLHYESMVTPPTTFDFDLESNNLITRKVQDIPSGYDPSLYQTKRLMARAGDGAMVPVSFVERVDRQTAGPIHLYAYGAYGHGMSPGFS
ncbi:MAG: S9 family peptidase, partial [Pseudomonadota bacterium]